MKRRILIFKAFNYPNDSPGALRIKYFAKYLVKLGYFVHLYAIKDEKYDNILAVSQEAVKDGVNLQLLKLNPLVKFIEVWTRRFASRFPSKHQGFWLISRLLAKRVLRTIKKGEIDVVIASYPFCGSLPIIKRLTNKLGAHLVIDFRDLPDELDPEQKNLRIKKLVKKLIPFVKCAKLVTTVSNPLVLALNERYGIYDAKEISNGYEGSLPIFQNRRIPMTKFVLLYPGSLAYGRIYELEILFGGLDIMMSNLGSNYNDIEIRIIGDESSKSFDKFKKFHSFKCLKLLRRKPRAEVLKMEATSAVLLSIASQGVKGILTSKIFEYLISGRPILSFPNDNDVLDDFLSKTGVAWHTGTAQGVADILTPLFNEWKVNKSLRTVELNKEFVFRYSRENQTKRLADYLEEILEGGNA